MSEWLSVIGLTALAMGCGSLITLLILDIKERRRQPPNLFDSFFDDHRT